MNPERSSPNGLNPEQGREDSQRAYASYGMKVIQIDLNKDYSEAIREAVTVLNYGGVIVYPTDTLYGLGANALNEIAVKKVFSIKKKSLLKPMPLIIKNMIWANELANITPKNREVLKKAWPGKITAVLSKKEIVPDIITSGHGTVGLRVPDYQFTDRLLGRFGYPLTSTSANISGEEGTGDINSIIRVFLEAEFKPDLVIDAGILAKSEPSAVLDLTTGKPKILRVGPSKPSDFLKMLKL